MTFYQFTKVSSARFLSSPKQDHQEGVSGCTKFQGSLAYAPKSQEEYNEYRDWFLGINKASGGDRFHDHWLSLTDHQDEDVWRDLVTGVEANFTDWGPGQPNGGSSQNCACLRKFNGYRWDDCGCSMAWPTICVRKQGLPVLKLRGLCPFSDIDTIFTPKNMGHEGELVFLSTKQNLLSFDESSASWEATKLNRKGNHTKAVTKALLTSMAIGTNLWTIHNDSQRCSSSSQYDVTLTLTGCSDDEFTCKEGFCVDMEQRCDGIVNCRDKSDEVGCSKLVVEDSYSRNIAPPPVSNRKKTAIRIAITIHSILQIDEIGETFSISFNQDALWTDPRLLYKNLKRNTNLNVLNQEEAIAIWTPQIVFSNTKGKDMSLLDDRAILSLIPGADFNFERTDQTNYENIYMFKGTENHIKLSKTHNTAFLCQYDMAWYPFDSQVCTMDIELSIVQSSFCSLEVESLSYLGPTDLVQYFIRYTDMVVTEASGSQGVRVHVVLGRRILSSLLTVYIPTVLLNIMGHVTVYFKPFFFEAIITVNLTVMLVLTTM